MTPIVAAPVRIFSDVRRVAFAVMASLVFGAAAGSSSHVANATAHDSTAGVPAWLRGVWTRDWILEGMVKSNTLEVHYLQTPTYFADIRIPKDRTSFTKA